MAKLKLKTNMKDVVAENNQALSELKETDASTVNEAVINNEAIDKTLHEFTEKTENRKKYNNYRFWYIVCGIVIGILVCRLFIAPVAVVGDSMKPTYNSGQLLLTVNADLQKQFQYDEVVVFENESTNGTMYIKRVEGLPGDVIQIKDGFLYRNGTKIEESFTPMTDPGIYAEETTLQADEIFVLGDNRNASSDSRFIGPISAKDIRYTIAR